MRKYALSVLIICLAGVPTHDAVPGADESRKISSLLAGQWEWKIQKDGCTELWNYAFDENGKYTAKMEGCAFSSDESGNYYYGWYVADNHICFVDDERQYDGKKRRDSEYRKYFMEEYKKGLDTEYCWWKILDYDNDNFKIEETWIQDGEEYKEIFSMYRKQWLGEVKSE